MKPFGSTVLGAGIKWTALTAGSVGLALVSGSALGASDGKTDNSLRELRPCSIYWHYDDLSVADKARYHGIFQAAEAGNWKRYTELFARLENRALIGRVEAEKLLHPWKYRSEGRELVSWLTKYADHPRFNQAYKLAKLRVPAKQFQELRAVYKIKPFTLSHRVFVRNKKQEAVQQKKDQKLIDFLQRSAAPNDPQISRGSAYQAYRDGQHASAINLFSRLAIRHYKDTWRRHEYLFWMRRAALQLKRTKMTALLKAHIQSGPITFYHAQLQGSDKSSDQSVALGQMTVLECESLRPFFQSSHGKRAFYLMSLQKIRQAGQEFKDYFLRHQDLPLSAFLKLAHRLRLAGFQAWLIGRLPPDLQKKYVHHAYPLLPERYFQRCPVPDRDLVHAIARQESLFAARAKSEVGARGLLQIMPKTAAYIILQEDVPLPADFSLSRPQYNICVGEALLQRLGRRNKSGQDLRAVLAAWNGGGRYLKKQAIKDPLLYIETIKNGQTRQFVKRVLANLKTYRRLYKF